MLDWLTDWRAWAIVGVLVVTTYIQIVGKHIQFLSGLDRVDNLRTYRFLFGGPPWVQWLMFRWSGFIQILGIIAVAVFFGWRALLVTIAAMATFTVLVWRLARGHATEMVKVLEKAMHEQQR